MVFFYVIFKIILVKSITCRLGDIEYRGIVSTALNLYFQEYLPMDTTYKVAKFEENQLIQIEVIIVVERTEEVMVI